MSGDAARGALILENGDIFLGEIFGFGRETVGEVVFNTGMVGYQETITDPSYAGQILVMTYPLIGNYGLNLDDFEGSPIFLRGLVVGERCDFPNNFRSEMKLQGFLRQNNVTAITGVDTRRLTRLIRTNGTMRGIITSDADMPEAEAREILESFDNSKIISEVSTKRKYAIDRIARDITKISQKVALIDMGVKKSIIHELLRRECEIIVFPHDVSAAEILAESPDVVLISNGPGDPKSVPETIKTARELIGKIPLRGICMGHQIIGLALGGDTRRLKFGHHGINHPVRSNKTGKIFITSQNHDYFVSDVSASGLSVTFENLTDGTIEGFESEELGIKSVQFHPEASPGPLETRFLFDEFLEA